MYKYDCTSRSPSSWVGSWSSPDFWTLNRNSVGYAQDPDHLQVLLHHSFLCHGTWQSFSCSSLLLEPVCPVVPLDPQRFAMNLKSDKRQTWFISSLWFCSCFAVIKLAYPEWHIDTNLDSHHQIIVSRIRSGELGISVIILQILWPRKYSHFWNWNEEKSTEI